MYKRCITERSAKQQQSIESAFLELLDTKPYKHKAESVMGSALCLPKLEQISLCSLAACNIRESELTSHALFKEGDVMSIVEEFWYGNIEPAEYDISPSNFIK